jgi:hypothetical protein
MSQFPARILLLAMVLLAGCLRPVPESQVNSQTTLNLAQFASSQSIKTYLNTQVASRGFNGQPYCAYEVLGAEVTDRGYNLYAWALCQEYYRKDNKLELGTGSAFPVALVLQRTGDQFEAISHRQPRDGALYAEDLPNIFPKSVVDLLQSDSGDRASQRGARLQAEVRKEAGSTQ